MPILRVKSFETTLESLAMFNISYESLLNCLDFSSANFEFGEMKRSIKEFNAKYGLDKPIFDIDFITFHHITSCECGTTPKNRSVKNLVEVLLCSP